MPGSQNARRDRRLIAGAAAGCVGGLVASWLMVEFQRKVWPPPKGDSGEPSTTKLARQLAELGGVDQLSDDQAKISGELIHYALGATLGSLYGTAVSSNPEVATGVGLPFGVVTEIVFDQALVPALGLSNPIWKCPIEWHVRGLAAHLIFGLTTEALRRLLIDMLDAKGLVHLNRPDE